MTHTHRPVRPAQAVPLRSVMKTHSSAASPPLSLPHWAAPTSQGPALCLAIGRSSKTIGWVQGDWFHQIQRFLKNCKKPGLYLTVDQFAVSVACLLHKRPGTICVTWTEPCALSLFLGSRIKATTSSRFPTFLFAFLV